MRRVVIPELLDTDAGTPAEIRASLRDLRFINTCFGGVRTTTWLVEQATRQTGKPSLSLLEVAAGSGYVPERTRAALLGRSAAGLGGSGPGVVGDGLARRCGDARFGLVSCSRFAHDLEPEG